MLFRGHQKLIQDLMAQNAGQQQQMDDEARRWREREKDCLQDNADLRRTVQQHLSRINLLKRGKP